MENAQSLAMYVAQLSGLAEADAVQRVRSPMLVQTSGQPGALRREFYTATEVGLASSSKPSLAPRSTSLAPRSTPLAPSEREVHAVRKRADGLFGDIISVGRTPNLDVCIARSEVSKFHAFFSRDDKGRYLLTDKNSTNGTFVGITRLTPGEAQVVLDGVVVRFGVHSFSFMEANSFVRFIHGLDASYPHG